MLDVKLFATLRDGREKAYKLPVEDFPTPAAIYEHLDIPPEDVAILLVNGFHSDKDVALKDGDFISIFPPCAGG